jgi:hypothetical protein
MWEVYQTYLEEVEEEVESAKQEGRYPDGIHNYNKGFLEGILVGREGFDHKASLYSANLSEWLDLVHDFIQKLASDRNIELSS